MDNMKHFQIKNVDVDLYLDVDQRMLKLCVVGVSGEDEEVYINGLCNSENIEGWVPHLLFETVSNRQSVRVGSVDSGCYGRKY